MLKPFQIPYEDLLSDLFIKYPCRQSQIRSLSSLLTVSSPSPKNIVLYGAEATGKSSIILALLESLVRDRRKAASPLAGEVDESDAFLQYAIVKSKECITGRHLLEKTLSAVGDAVQWKGSIGRCENLAQLAVELDRLLKNINEPQNDMLSQNKFVLVFDGIDKQRDAPATLLPALARMGEFIPNLTIVYVVTSPRPHFLHIPGVPHIHFPAYTKSEALQVLGLEPRSIYPEGGAESSPASQPQAEKDRTAKESKEVWARFCSAIWDTLAKHSGRDIISLRAVCARLWTPFTQPLRDRELYPKDFSRLLLSKRALLQNESTLISHIVTPTCSSPNHSSLPNKPSFSGLATQLPHVSRILLVAAYVASYTPARHDFLLFSKSVSRGKRKRGGGTALTSSRPGISKSRKINRKLLGPQSFVVERLLAIFHVLKNEAQGLRGARGLGMSGAADVMMGIATLGSLRLVVRTSSIADVLDASTKWKVNVGWEVVRSVARSVGVEVEDYIVD